ncbi:homeobox protein extradenticle isoform X1, partial [Vespula maculifrons]
MISLRKKEIQDSESFAATSLYGKALAGGPGATGWMQQREAVPEFPPLHDSADSDSDRENEKRPRNNFIQYPQFK